MATKMAKAHSVRFSVVLAGIAIGLISTCLTSAQESTVPPPGGECETRFMQGLFKCFTDFKVPFNTYLWAATNGTGGIPPDDKAAFSKHMCSVEDALVKCVLDSLHVLVDTPSCQQAEGLDALLTVQVRTIFEQYDNYCAHDCRQTLKSDLQNCYTDNGVDETLFLVSDGAILGSSSFYVSEFCENRDKLMTCMKTKKDACPESPYVMRKIGLDLDTFKTGVELLCQRQDVYINSLDCFSEQTRAVEKCGEDNSLTLRRLVRRSQQKNSTITEHQFLEEFCLARLKYVLCDLKSWKAKTAAACDRPALTLKRDLHCKQIPHACRTIMSSEIQDACTSDYGRLPAAQENGWSWNEQADAGTSVRATVSTLLVALPLLISLTVHF